MRIVNPETDTEFYLSRIKEGKAPQHIDRIKPVIIVIEKEEIEVFSNPLKSNYCYLFTCGEWMACRNHDLAKQGDTNMQILNMGRPYKARDKQAILDSTPVITIDRHQRDGRSYEVKNNASKIEQPIRPIKVIKHNHI